MKHEEERYSKIQWFFMVILIPVVFAIILFSIILNLMGVNVLDHAKQIAANVPYLSEYVKTDELLSSDVEKIHIEELSAVAKAREMEIEQLKSNIASKETEIQSLQDEIKMLMTELEEKQGAQDIKGQEYKSIAKMYVTMSAKNAASILSELPEEEAALQLSFLKPDVSAAILAKMKPEKAAQLITLMNHE